MFAYLSIPLLIISTHVAAPRDLSDSRASARAGDSPPVLVLLPRLSSSTTETGTAISLEKVLCNLSLGSLLPRLAFLCGLAIEEMLCWRSPFPLPITFMKLLTSKSRPRGSDSAGVWFSLHDVISSDAVPTECACEQGSGDFCREATDGRRTDASREEGEGGALVLDAHPPSCRAYPGGHEETSGSADSSRSQNDI